MCPEGFFRYGQRYQCGWNGDNKGKCRKTWGQRGIK